MNVLMVGDIFGESGRAALSKLLPRLREQHAIDFCVVNCENAAGGFGVTPPMAKQMLEQGADVLTSGNHIWDKKEIVEFITKADIVSDLDAYQLAKDISKRIEAEMQYPGHIKVVVIRETRAVEVAK